MSQETNKSNEAYLLPETIIIHSHAFLLQLILRRMTLQQVAASAKVLGFDGLFSELLRKNISPTAIETNDSVIHLAEPARSETLVRDYAFRSPLRLFAQLFYLLIEKHRFNPDVIEELITLQQALERANQTTLVRVYERKKNSHSAIDEKGIKNKILAPEQQERLDYLLKVTKGWSPEKTAEYIVNQFKNIVQKYEVDGIELNLLAFITQIRDSALLRLTLEKILSARHPDKEDQALVQTIAIQPRRRDLGPQKDITDFGAALAIISKHFSGTIIYAPNKVDKNTKDEVRKVQEILRSDTQ